MQAKKIWSDCRKQRLDALTSQSTSETLKQPSLQPISTETGTLSHSLSPSVNEAPKELQESYIFTLRRCYSNVESENNELKQKISRLQNQITESNQRLHNLRDYDDLKRKSALGFDAGFESGQSEVRNYDTPLCLT